MAVWRSRPNEAPHLCRVRRNAVCDMVICLPEMAPPDVKLNTRISEGRRHSEPAWRCTVYSLYAHVQEVRQRLPARRRLRPEPAARGAARHPRLSGASKWLHTRAFVLWIRGAWRMMHQEAEARRLRLPLPFGGGPCCRLLPWRALRSLALAGCTSPALAACSGELWTLLRRFARRHAPLTKGRRCPPALIKMPLHCTVLSGTKRKKTHVRARQAKEGTAEPAHAIAPTPRRHRGSRLLLLLCRPSGPLPAHPPPVAAPAPGAAPPPDPPPPPPYAAAVARYVAPPPAAPPA